MKNDALFRSKCKESKPELTIENRGFRNTKPKPGLNTNRTNETT